MSLQYTDGPGPPEFEDEKFTVVTLCGSMKFRDTMMLLAEGFSLEGCIVLAPFVTFSPTEQLTDTNKWMLDRMHMAKIDMSEAIYVVNPGGYVGDSTRREIEYARYKGIRVESLEALDV